jgi:hypothetical protein
MALASWPVVGVENAAWLRARCVLGVTAARLVLDRVAEEELLARGLLDLPGNPGLLDLSRSAPAHYQEIAVAAQQVLQEAPEDTTASFDLARLRAGERQYRAAQQLITGTVLRWRRNFVEAYAVLAEVLEHGGHADGIRGVVEINGLPYCGEAVDVLEAAVRGYLASGRAELARRDLELLRRREPERPGLLHLGARVAFALGEDADGRRLLEQALRAEPLSRAIERDWKRLGGADPATPIPGRP